MTAGRPRAFDYDQALDKAMRVFWAKGFDGTTMPDLTEAMNMNRPSIYAAFGNKEELFRKALDRYAQNSADIFREKLNAPTLRQSLENFLMHSASSLACTENPRGCLAVQGALVGGEDSNMVCDQAKGHREGSVCMLNERIQRAVKEGELSASTDTIELARFYATVLQGMSIQSVSGATCDQLKAIAMRALQALPA